MDERLEQVTREGSERCNPSLTNPSWLVLSRRRRLFDAWMHKLPNEQIDVLDIGGRIQPYRSLLRGRVRRYIAVDVRTTPLVDVIAKGEQLPIGSNLIDLVLCTQVLEYIAEPATVLEEIHRVLKPGGRLFLSVPAMFPTDSEQDLWRFTPGSLRFLLRDFRNVEIQGEGSSIHGLFRTIALWVSCFARPRSLARLLRIVLIPLLNVIAEFLGFVFPTKNDQFTANFSVFAQK